MSIDAVPRLVAREAARPATDTSALDDLIESIVKGDASMAKVLTEQVLLSGKSPSTVIEEAVLPAMEHVNEIFKEGRIVIPDVLLASRAAHAALYFLEPYLVQGGKGEEGTVVIGTVAGDLHDIGKKLVSLMAESKGIRVIDLGVDVVPEDFVEAVITFRPQIVAMSALLTTTMPGMKHTIEALKSAGLRDSVFVALGGGPVNRDFARAVGADIYAYDAAEASRLFLSSLQGMKTRIVKGRRLQVGTRRR